MKIKIHQGFWTRDEVAKDTDCVYVFGDNAEDTVSGHVPSETQACIRGLPNAIGLSTKRNRRWHDNSFFKDTDLEIFKILVEATIELIKTHAKLGKTIVFPSDGLGTGRARLKKNSTECWEYLCKRLKEEFDYDNGQIKQGLDRIDNLLDQMISTLEEHQKYVDR